VSDPEGVPPEGLSTTQAQRAEYLAGLRNEIMKALVRYQHECGITLEECLACLSMTHALLLKDWLDQEPDDGEEEEGLREGQRP
jgi:hypothetical protein